MLRRAAFNAEPRSAAKSSPFEQNAPEGGVHQPHDHARQRGLARTGFADDAEHLARLQVEGDVIDGDHLVARRIAKQPGQCLDPQQRRRGLGRDRPRRSRLVVRKVRLQQRARVVMLRRGEERRQAPLLDDAPGLHHIGAVADLIDDAEIVRDQQTGKPHLLAQIGDEREHLRLHRDIERGGGLVRDQELRLAGDGRGNHHALALAARHLVRIAIHRVIRRRDADEIEQLDGAFARGRAAEAAMDHERLHDLIAAGEDRIERGHRLLEDHADVVAARGAHLALRGGGEIAPAEQNAARGDPDLMPPAEAAAPRAR